MSQFEIVSDFGPMGDQLQAIDRLVSGLGKGFKHQTLLGVTGSGKTFTMANVIQRVNRPTLVISHNKTLAAQLYTEFKEFFPNNAVEYFVSYYDYYQPEAYLPRTDTYIEKDADVNEEIDKLRHAATRALFEHRDVIIVASVSCIYGLGEPEEYRSFVCRLERGGSYRREKLLRQMVDMQYERNDIDFTRGKFRIRGDTLEIQPAYEELALRIEFFGDEVERIVEIEPLTGEVLAELNSVNIYPAKHFVTSRDKLTRAIEDIQRELAGRLDELKRQGKMLEAARLQARTNYDLEMLREAGYCTGAENYSRHLSGRPAGSPPWTLLDYFPDDFLMFIDESHMTLPQIRGMYSGDRSRKETLVEYGFRLPSALDNRPLNFDEFGERINQIIYTSATPS
ncbi:MAG: DEAD/DEAH box helicase family protein, partial [Dehalococcoidales bacterium]|nr:DEAD/DEAH box helicase family protein [Dehalococcoidales bacterium]